MSLDAATRDILEKRTRFAPNPLNWSGSWLSILSKLFPISQSYSICPHKRNGAHGDLIMDVAKDAPSESPTERSLRILLVVDIKDPQHWYSGKEKLLQQFSG